MRILGIDWGTKKIGIAIANSISKNITPIGVFSNNKNIFYKIKQIVLNYNVKKIIIGKPVFTKTYEESPIFYQIQDFAQNLQGFLMENNISIEIDYIEEEYTTFLANNLIKYSTFKNKKNKVKKKLKNNIDSLSAVWILKSYISIY
ncbi:MAG: Holliday junction resolvase RuvX [bacterium]|nr:Holliday junction resolvase RuvX [bacterium]